METKANFVLLGAATVVGVILIMLFALWLSNSELQRGHHDYDVVFSEPVRGLAQGGEVRFNGIKVGEVRSLRIDPDNANRTIARIRVFSDTPVRRDSVAQLEPVGITGVTLIQLSAGHPNQPLLIPRFGEVLEIPGSGSEFDRLFASGATIAAQVRDLLAPENIAHVRSILTNLDEISTSLKQRDSVIARSGETARAMTEAATSVSALAQRAQTDIAQLDEAIGALNSAAQEASNQTLPEITRAAQDIRRAANAASRVANNVEHSPSIITPHPQRPTVELQP